MMIIIIIIINNNYYYYSNNNNNNERISRARWYMLRRVTARNNGNGWVGKTEETENKCTCMAEKDNGSRELYL